MHRQTLKGKGVGEWGIELHFLCQVRNVPQVLICEAREPICLIASDFNLSQKKSSIIINHGH